MAFYNIQNITVISNKKWYQLPTTVNEQLQIINLPNASAGNDIAAIKYQKVDDKIQTGEDTLLQRVTYETLLHSIKRDVSRYLKNSLVKLDNSTSGFYNYGAQQNAFYKPKAPYYLSKRFITIDNQVITGLQIESDNEDTPNKRMLGITNEENSLLKNLISQNSLVNAKVYFNDNSYNNEEYYTSPEGIEYKQYNLFIVAEDIEGTLKLFKPENPFKVFHIKGLVYASNDYAKATPERFNSSIGNDYILPLTETDLTNL
ncbi:MAG: hypothetical protein HRT67_10560 [Flavobacteriaceae bacterium]|nr:hypothetical protein [Flavobacteriaceae bacterium]